MNSRSGIEESFGKADVSVLFAVPENHYRYCRSNSLADVRF